MMFERRTFMLSLALPLITASPASAQSCRPYWAEGTMGLPKYPLSMVAWRDGMGSYLFTTPISTAGNVYRWSDGQWADISAALPSNQVRLVSVYILDDGAGPALYALGNTQPPVVHFGRKWNGSAWVETPPGFVAEDGTDYPIQSITVGQASAIYGHRRTTFGGPLYAIRWSGSEWIPLGPALPAINFRYFAFDDGTGPHLYVIGDFATIGGVAMHGLARWSGSDWQAVPGNHTNISDAIYGLVVYDDGHGSAVYVYADVYLNGSSQPLPGVARWDGQTWIGMGGPAGPGVGARTGLAVFDDGSGPALYVTGQFSDWGGVPAVGIAKWNGQTWSTVDWGIVAGSEVTAIAVGDGPAGPTMYIGGLLTRAGAGSVKYIAQRVGCPNCYTNCDTSTVGPRLNVRDFICFLNKFAANDPYADCNASITIDVADFACFVNKFTAGCP